MTRTTNRVEFLGHASFTLAGIVEVPSRSPRGGILFSHCFTCNKDLKAIVRISRELADLGWSVLRYDFMGLGGSQGQFQKSSFTTNRQDLAGAFRFLKTTCDHPIFLMGHSFGGAASLSMAQELDVQGVIALAAPSDTRHLAELLQRMDPRIWEQGIGSVSIGGRSYTVERQMIEDFLAFDLAKLVQALSKPLLAIHSTADETVDFRHAYVNCRFGQVPFAANRSLFSLSGSNHLLTNQPGDCKRIAILVDTWCRGLLDP